MNKSETLKQLKEALKDVPELLKLSHESPKRNIWVYRVDNILKDGFGPNSDELKLFVEGVPRDELKGSNRQLQKWLDSRLKRRATIVQSVIDNLELQVEKEQTEGEGDTKVKLEHFRDELIEYKGLVEKQENGMLTRKQQIDFESLRSKLWRGYGSLEKVIGPCPRFVRKGFLGSEEYNLFDLAIGPQRGMTNTTDVLEALETAICILDRVIGRLETTIIAMPIQLPQDIAEPPNLLFEKMQLHPKIIAVSKRLFQDGHYPQAIFEAFKAVDNFVKKRTGLSIYGKDLMGKVFNVDNPIIKLNELRTKSNRSEQEGFMYLFMGAMEGIRNPKAHDEVAELDPYKTLEYLGFASLLMRRADEGKKKRPRKKQPKSTQA